MLHGAVAYVHPTDKRNANPVADLWYRAILSQNRLKDTAAF